MAAISFIFQEKQLSPPVTGTGTHPLLRARSRESSQSDDLGVPRPVTWGLLPTAPGTS